jgi:hypothetical protein
MTLFASAEEKIRRATHHTNSLKGDVARFFAEKTYEIRQVPNFETGRKQAVYRALADLPGEWPIILGEIMHNLRSALDHMITALTILEKGHALEGTEFPVFESEFDYSRVRSKGPHRGEPAAGSGLHKIRGLGSNAKAVVRSLKPFEVRKTLPPQQQPALALIHALNVIDKHRSIHVVRRMTANYGWRVVRDINLPFNFKLPVGEVTDGTILAEWSPVGALDSEIDMEFEWGFDLCFGDGDQEVAILNGSPVIPICESLIHNGARHTLSRLAATVPL